MHLTSLRRVALLVVAILASGLSLVAVSASPAHATAYTSFAELETNYAAVRYGSKVTITARVGYNESSPTYVDAGTVTLQRAVYGKGWANVSSKTITASTTDLKWALAPSNTTSYRILYFGGSANGDTYSKAVSNVDKVGVRRNLHDNFSQSSRNFYGTVTPNYGGKTLYIQKSTCSNPESSSCTWGLYKTLRTTSAGKWVVKLPVYSRKTHFRALVKASSGYLVSYSNYYVTTYRY